MRLRLLLASTAAPTDAEPFRRTSRPPNGRRTASSYAFSAGLCPPRSRSGASLPRRLRAESPKAAEHCVSLIEFNTALHRGFAR